MPCAKTWIATVPLLRGTVRAPATARVLVRPRQRDELAAPLDSCHARLPPVRLAAVALSPETGTVWPLAEAELVARRSPPRGGLSPDHAWPLLLKSLDQYEVCRPASNLKPRSRFAVYFEGR